MTFTIGPGLKCDLERLVDTRLLVQANSGGGKSWLLRRLLEQTHGDVQHLVIDPEGEFVSLREKFDYVHAAKAGGDTAADPRSAALLAERLLELKVSAILDIYELKAHERVRFVRYFLDALVNAPKKLWHPALVVLDEAHVYAPEKGEAESASAVIDLSTRGRKRGFSIVLATQRLAKLHKDAAAECNNKLIGRTTLDVDVKRAANELGMREQDARLVLRELVPGEFFGYGPAFEGKANDYGVIQATAGEITTTHPKAGAHRKFEAPGPTAAITKLLPNLKDLPAEAEQRAQSVADLKRQIVELKQQIAAKVSIAPAKETRVVERFVLKDGQLARAEKLVAQLAGVADRFGVIGENVAGYEEDLRSTAKEIRAAIDKTTTSSPPSAVPVSPVSAPRPAPVTPPKAVGGSRPVPQARPAREVAEGNGTMTGAAQRILNALAGLEQVKARPPARELVAFMAGYTHTQSKGFRNALGRLRSDLYIDYPSDGTVALTVAGRALADPSERPRTPRELQDRIIRLLGGASGRILEPLIEAYPGALTREQLAGAASYGHLQSKGFRNALGRLRKLGFLDYPDRGTVQANPVLFLEERP